VELRSSSIEYIHERAKALQMCASFPAQLQHAASLVPSLFVLHFCFRFGRHSDAILDFTTVLNARPRFANARFRRAFSYK
jgi:hypothetical protein